MVNDEISFCFDWLRELGFVWHNDWSMIKNGYIVSYDPAFGVWSMSDLFGASVMASNQFNHVLSEVRYLKLN